MDRLRQGLQLPAYWRKPHGKDEGALSCNNFASWYERSYSSDGRAEALVNRESIFICYRRDDSADASARIFERLKTEFGVEAVFIDVHKIPVGQDFAKHIRLVLAQCRVFLTVIGPRWLAFETPSEGRRLDDQLDHVRLEIETALEGGTQVIPILLHNTEMPRERDLPTSLRPLSGMQAARIRRDPDFHRDMDTLIRALREGALSGSVSVPTTEEQKSAAEIWSRLKASNNIEELRRFAENYVGTEQGLEARTRIAQLEEFGPVWQLLQKIRNETSPAFARRLLAEADPQVERFSTKWRGVELTDRLVGERSFAHAHVQALAESEEIEATKRLREQERRLHEREANEQREAVIQRFTAEQREKWNVLSVVKALDQAEAELAHRENKVHAARDAVGETPEYNFGMGCGGAVGVAGTGIIALFVLQIAERIYGPIPSLVSIPVLALIFWPLMALILYPIQWLVYGLRKNQLEKAQRALDTALRQHSTARAAAEDAWKPYQQAVEEFRSSLES